MDWIDLHIHTTCSDGQFSPKETMRMAHAAGVTVAAVTDHDTVSGVAEAREATAQYGMQFFSGIEISVQSIGELHILGYGVDPESSALSEFCRKHAEARKMRSVRLLQYLQKRGVSITMEDVARYNAGKTSGRPHFARALMEMGYAESVKDAFAKYLTTPEYYAHVERPKPTPKEGIQLIQDAGGVAVLAHPHQLQLDNAALDAFIEKLTAMGLRGIEAYYSCHTAEQTEFYLQLARKYRLLYTCGSDFHGPAVKPEIALGTGIDNCLCISDKEIPQRLTAALQNVRKPMKS